MRRFLVGLIVAIVAPGTAAAARPDKTLYDQAKAARTRLDGSARLKAGRSEWGKVAIRFRSVVTRYPQSPYCDDALLSAGDLYREMANRFRSPRYNDDAVENYSLLVAEYPSSRLGEKALHAVFEIANEGGDRRKILDTGRRYLENFPEGPRAAEIKSTLRKKAAAQPAALPSPPPKGLLRMFDLRSWSGESSTRVVLYLEKEVTFQRDRIGNPDRLYIDLLGIRLHPNLTHRSFPVGDGLLEQVRIGQYKADVVRVVLDFKEVHDYGIFYLADPTRLVVDVKGTPRTTVAEKQESLPIELLPTSERAPSPSVDTRSRETQQSRTAGEQPRSSKPPVAAATSAPERTATTTAEASRDRATVEPVAPSRPTPNRSGNLSIARQLGLRARRIVIDPGHGGHDPGAIGRNGLQEKDLVLDVARRLEQLVQSELKAEVVMTRSTDVFIPLEERTAIAISEGADLFLSIHANSHPSRQVRGVETYYLNFAVDAHAEEVAARENAISPATLKDLQGIVKAIAQNSKIEESRDFAASVQEAMIESLRQHYPDLPNLGVKRAPFYVLLGANMPSVLAEIAFVSHSQEEKRLRSSEYRDRIARSLLEGVKRYLSALNGTPPRQLTGRQQGSTVGDREARR